MLTLNPAQWARSGRWVSFAMLLSLQVALWLGIDNLWAKPLLLAHLGLFLMWQPLWNREVKLSWGSSTIIIGICLTALLWLNWWVLAFWVSGLFALVGGRVFAFYPRWQRFSHLWVMTYLLAVLLLYITPELFKLQGFDDTARTLLDIGLALFLIILVFIPVERERIDSEQAVDFVYVLLLFTLITLLVLGSLAFMTLAQAGYFEAVLRSLFMLAVALFVLGVLWNPHMGFSGLRTGFSRYVLSIGTPLEEWLKQISLTAQQEHDPVTFLRRAMQHLSKMPWIAGIAWQADVGHGTLGVAGEHRVQLDENDLTLTLFTQQAISPAVLMHMRLLVHVLGHFYQAKRREQQLREMTRQQTIHEAGARLTHDLKNMLQSLFALTSVAQHDAAKAQPILQNQLPILTQRIELLLTKLKAPEAAEHENQMALATWWDSVRQRHQHREVEWVSAMGGEKNTLTPTPLPEGEGLNLNDEELNPNPNPLHPNSLSPRERAGVRESLSTESTKNGEPAPIESRPSLIGGGEPLSTAHKKLSDQAFPHLPNSANAQLIPAALFDCVLDNLLENACNKRLREPGIRIVVNCVAHPLCIEVRDSGSPVPESIARNLLRTIVPSEDGLGVGLYQAARWAQQQGYWLALMENRAGNVRFEFKPLVQ
jgi:signal transduction histidine kinase